jgi:hypothetical protein
VLFSLLFIYCQIFKTLLTTFCQQFYVCQTLKTKCETAFIADKRHVYSLATNAYNAINQVYTLEKKIVDLRNCFLLVTPTLIDKAIREQSKSRHRERSH